MILSSFLLEILSLLNLCFDIASKRILCCPLIGHRIFRNRRDLPSFYGQLSARVLLQVRSEISTFLQKTVTYRPSGLSKYHTRALLAYDKTNAPRSG